MSNKAVSLNQIDSLVGSISDNDYRLTQLLVDTLNNAFAIAHPSDYLVLTIAFPDESTTTLSLPDPRSDLTANDISALGTFIANNQIFINDSGQFATGISHAVIQYRNGSSSVLVGGD